jgi:hypothetical protein
LPEEAWKPLVRLARYEIATEPRRPGGAEFDYQPNKCGRSYRLVVVRKNISVQKGELVLFEDNTFSTLLTTHPLKQISLYLPAVLEARIQAHPSRMVESELMRGLICAALKEATPAKKHELSRWSQNRVSGRKKVGQITLLEASTGIGKSRVIARIILELAKKRRNVSECSGPPSRWCITYVTNCSLRLADRHRHRPQGC